MQGTLPLGIARGLSAMAMPLAGLSGRLTSSLREQAHTVEGSLHHALAEAVGIGAFGGAFDVASPIESEAPNKMGVFFV